MVEEGGTAVVFVAHGMHLSWNFAYWLIYDDLTDR